jgi:hypothetical protein
MSLPAELGLFGDFMFYKDGSPFREMKQAE